MKVLLCHASLGWGHKRAAQAVEEVLKERKIPSVTHDLLDFLIKPMGPFYSHSYTFMITRSRWMWRLIHDRTDRADRTYNPATANWQRWQFRPWLRELQKEKFTHIFSTHFTTSALLAQWKKKYGWTTRISSIITDYSAHRYWKRPGLDHYFAPTEEVTEQLLSGGISAGTIVASGIPIGSAFLNPVSREDVRREWACPLDASLILVLCSGLNFRKTRVLIEDLLKVKGEVHFLVSAGKHSPNEEFVNAMVQGDPRFTVFGFSSRIAEMMKSSDLIVTKPGGLVVSESLAAGLPQILMSPIPGQEEANAALLVKRGAAVSTATKQGAFLQSIEHLLADRARLASMAAVAKSMGKPDAARTVVDIGLD
ncbi:MAG TPA: glycosyltransferase [Acidobacteriota bacterium]|nr:glycosyltransferase [Acidobacteriota bacterium]